MTTSNSVSAEHDIISLETMLSNPKNPDLAFEDFEIVNHLMAMRMKYFDEKVPSDLAI